MGEETSPAMSAVEMAFRAAHRALEAISGDQVASEKRLTTSEVVSQFPAVVDVAHKALAAQLGPIIWWHAPPEDEWDPVIAVHDFDDDSHNIGEVKLDEVSLRGRDGYWFDSALDRAARAYRREAGWDHPPDDAGIWLLMLAPESQSSTSNDGSMLYGGHLVGFLIVRDRDEDNAYESVAHIWTASDWRRRGVAQRLLAEARKQFPIVEVEGPYTEDGSAFLSACFVD